MHRRLLSAAATSTLLLGLSACSEPTDGPVTTPPPSIDIGAPSDGGGDAEPSDGDGEKTAEPTAEAPDIPPPDPADYAGKDEHTAEGAEQAFKYYIAVSVWAHQTGSNDILQQMTGASCTECLKINSQIEELQQSEQYWSKTSITTYGSETYKSENYDHEIGYIYIVGKHSEPSDDGSSNEVPELAYTAIGGMHWDESHWIIEGLSIQETESEL